jgi:peptidase A4-like protein
MHPQQLSTPLETLRKQLPFELHPTNLPGAFTTPAPARDFDPQKASAAALIKHGVMWKRPQKGDPFSLLRAWERAFSREWHAKDRLIPHSEPQYGKTHVLRRLAKAADTGYTSDNWSGGVIQGQWATAIGFWSIPTVSKPAEPQGAEGGWNSSSWIGIDGFSSNDVLQAGIQQRVTPGGIAQYVAWYEWFAPAQANSPGYIYQTDIVNFPVAPGQQVYCCVQYIHNKTAGNLYFANDTTGQHLSITLAPPPGASFAGDSIEWIMEAPDGGEPVAALPKFSPVQFTTALGCSSDGQVVGNPQNGDYINILYNNQTLTAVSLANDAVTVKFTG